MLRLIGYYFFESFLSFRAISSISFGFSSASTLSTILAMVSESVAKAEELPFEEAAAAIAPSSGTGGFSCWISLNAVLAPAAALGVESMMLSRISLQFAHAAALAASSL